MDLKEALSIAKQALDIRTEQWKHAGRIADGREFRSAMPDCIQELYEADQAECEDMADKMATAYSVIREWMDKAEQRALVEDEEDNDYRLRDGHNSAWIAVGNISVYIVRADEGVSVDLCAAGREADSSLAATWATFSEAEEPEVADAVPE